MAVTTDVDFYWSIFELNWINYYEIILWDYEEELEVLGWIIGFENLYALITVSCILSIACFTLVHIILNARKYRFLFLDNKLNFKYSISFLSFKVQNTFLQEFGSIGAPKHIFKLFHRRRI